MDSKKAGSQVGGAAVSVADGGRRGKAGAQVGVGGSMGFGMVRATLAWVVVGAGVVACSSGAPGTAGESTRVAGEGLNCQWGIHGELNCGGGGAPPPPSKPPPPKTPPGCYYDPYCYMAHVSWDAERGPIWPPGIGPNFLAYLQASGCKDPGAYSPGGKWGNAGVMLYGSAICPAGTIHEGTDPALATNKCDQCTGLVADGSELVLWLASNDAPGGCMTPGCPPDATPPTGTQQE